MGDETDGCDLRALHGSQQKMALLGSGQSLLWEVAGIELLLQSKANSSLCRGDQVCLQGQILYVRIACSLPFHSVLISSFIMGAGR